MRVNKYQIYTNEGVVVPSQLINTDIPDGSDFVKGGEYMIIFFSVIENIT